MDSLYCGKWTLLGQCPMSNSSKLFSNTTTCSSFKWTEPLFFSYRVHRHTHRRKDTQTDMSTLQLWLINRNYNNFSECWRNGYRSVIRWIYLGSVAFILWVYNVTREGFLRKNIVAVSFFQNCAIHQYS